VVVALMDSGWGDLVRRARALDACCTKWGMRVNRVNPEKSRPVPLNRCRDRLCPSCSRARAARLAGLVSPLLQEVHARGGTPKFLTLTQRSRVGENPKRSLDRLNKSFTNFRRCCSWKKKVRSYVAARELTFNRKRGTWHGHLHLVMDADWWDQAEIANEWEKVTGDSRVVDIRVARAGTERELLKYLVKAADLPAAQLRECAHSLRGVRGVSTGGAWYGKVRPEDLEREPGEDPEDEIWTFPELADHLVAGDPVARFGIEGVDFFLGFDIMPTGGFGV